MAVPLAVLPAVPAQAVCVPSEATATPAAAAPGQQVTVSSRTWFGICNDTGQQIDVTDRAVVTFVQSGLRTELGRTNSNASGVFRLRVRIPRQATAGPAVLEVRGRGSSDDVAFTVSPSLPRTGPAVPLLLLGLLTLGAGLTLARQQQRDQVYLLVRRRPAR